MCFVVHVSSTAVLLLLTLGLVSFVPAQGRLWLYRACGVCLWHSDAAYQTGAGLCYRSYLPGHACRPVPFFKHNTRVASGDVSCSSAGRRACGTFYSLKWQLQTYRHCKQFCDGAVWYRPQCPRLTCAVSVYNGVRDRLWSVCRGAMPPGAPLLLEVWLVRHDVAVL